jgi:ATP-binding cassette subfamily B protein
MLGSAAGIVLEAILFRAFLELAPELPISGQRLGALGALLALMLFLLFLELPINGGVFRLGRRLEARLRVAFQKKIPRLRDRYFHSRLTSDMAERNHSLHTLRLLPKIGGRLIRAGFEMLLTAAGIIWLDPSSAPLVLLATAFGLGIPFAAMPILAERELRVRSHAGGLGRFYLDALLGLVPVRAHGAAVPLRSEHEGLLVEWTRARRDLRWGVVVLEAAQSFVGYGLIVALLLSHLSKGGEVGTVLLLIYWALRLPVLGLEVMQHARQYPAQRNVMLRLLEPLGAPEDRIETVEASTPQPTEGVPVSIEGASVRAGGHLILQDIDLEIEGGSDVAIVGPSGAGKTSLFGLILGWHRPAQGRVFADGLTLEGKHLTRLRSQTAWVDPAVQLWNNTFLENLRYGSPDGFAFPLSMVIDQAALKRVLETLPDGHQTRIGESGGLVSGGEGQRVRLARALLRPGVRLVLLDEPFRGLNRPQRAELLARARRLWRHATIFCVTHDVIETRSFDRVLVMKSGRIVEDASPTELQRDPESHYCKLLDSEVALQRLWADPIWRRWQIEQGRIRETLQRATS